MWTVCITSISHVLKLNGHGGSQAKVNEKSPGFKGWETLVSLLVLCRLMGWKGGYKSACIDKYTRTYMPQMAPALKAVCLYLLACSSALSVPLNAVDPTFSRAVLFSRETFFRFYSFKPFSLSFLIFSFAFSK